MNPEWATRVNQGKPEGGVGGRTATGPLKYVVHGVEIFLLFWTSVKLGLGTWHSLALVIASIAA